MAKRKGPPPGEPPPEPPPPAPEPEPAPQPKPRPSKDDLTESSALVIMSASDVKRLDDSSDELTPPPDLGESRTEKPAEDLTESSALVIMSASDDRRFAGPKPPPLPSKKKTVPPKSEPPPPRRRRLGAVLLFVSLVLLISGVTGYAIHYFDEEERRREVADLNAERDRLRERVEGSERALREAFEGERAAKERELAGLRKDLETERRALADRALALEAEAKRREDDAREKEAAIRAELKAERDALADAAPREARERADRERLDLERRAKDTVDRYEALLVEAEKRRKAELELNRREAKAEILRRDALLKKQMEEQKAELAREKEKALAEETQKIEERLRAQYEAERGGFLKEKGGAGEGEPGGVDLESMVSKHLAGHLGGSAEYRLKAHFEDSAQPDANRVRNEGIAKLKYDAAFLDDKVTVKVVPRVRVDDDGLSYSTQQELEDEKKRRPVFTLEEAHVGAHFGAVDVTVGKQIFAWGTGDIVNPTDVMNPVDYTDLLDSEKIGIFAVDASVYPTEETRLRLVLAPTFTPSRLPIAGKRFSLLPPEGLFFPAPPPLNQVGPIGVDRSDLPPDGLEAFQAALRASTTISGVDLALTYYAGVNRLSNLQVRALGAPPFVTLTPVFDRVHMFGGDFATTTTVPLLGEIQVHGEVAQFVTEGSRDDDYLQYVIGLEKNASDPLFEKELSFILEHAAEWIEVHRKRTDIIPATKFARAFTDALLGRVTWKPVEHLELLMTAVAIIESPQSWYFRPEARYELGAHTKIAAGLDILRGSQSGFFGQFAEDDRFFLSLKLTF